MCCPSMNEGEPLPSNVSSLETEKFSIWSCLHDVQMGLNEGGIRNTLESRRKEGSFSADENSVICSALGWDYF